MVGLVKPPEWFLEMQRDVMASKPPGAMEWVPEGFVISAEEATRREAGGWKLIDQVNNRSPKAAPGYGRHWIKWPV